MKKLILTLTILAGFAMQALAYDFQSGNLLYTIISTDPPCVSLDGHIDGENAQGELIIPETVTYEGVSYAVTEISNLAFRNCIGLIGTLVIPETVKIVGEQAFYNCSGFTGLVLPIGLIEIREMAFMNCTGLNGALNLPETLKYLKYGAFANCTGFSGDLILPNSIVEVGNSIYPGYLHMFEHVSTFADSFDHLVLSQSLDTIGLWCFAGCTRLTGELVAPEGLKAINTRAFDGCTGLTGLTLNDSVVYIGAGAFANCSGITGTVAFPENVNIGNYGFEGCVGIEELILPNNNLLGGYVFESCTSLSELDIPEGWIMTGNSNFASCTNLRSVHLPESLTTIDLSSFSGCTNLVEINIPEGVTEIGNSAFSGCNSLTHIELPSTLRVLGSMAFSGCTSLSGELVIPDLVQRIEMSTFRSCALLNRVVLGNSINYIAEPAFQDTELDSLVIKAMTPPELRRMTTQGAWHFPIDIPIIVPCGAMEAYQNDENWGEFTNITEDCSSGLVGFDGAEWYYEIQNENGSITYQHLEYAADTTINHKEVVVIIRTNTLYDKAEHQEVTREYVYEEDGVVYWWNPQLQDFTVLYDFGAEEGGEWEIKVGLESFVLHVDAVGQYYYEGRLFKMLQVSDVDNVFSGTIVCGIGHLTSFFPEKLMNRGKSYRVEGMRCFWSDGELVFKYGRKDCDEVYEEWHSGIEEDGPSTGSGTLNVYPNPTSGVLFVETRFIASQPTEYRITNLMGQTLMSGNITAENQQMDVSNLPEGMYFITVGGATRKFVVRFL